MNETFSETANNEEMNHRKRNAWIAGIAIAFVIAIAAIVFLIPNTIYTNDRLAQTIDMLDENIKQGEGGRFFVLEDKSAQLSRVKDMANGLFVNRNLKEEAKQLEYKYEYIKQQDAINDKMNSNHFATANEMAQNLDKLAQSIEGGTYAAYADTLYKTIKDSATQYSYFELVEKRMYELMNEYGVTMSYHDINDLYDNNQNFGICGYVTCSRTRPYSYSDEERVTYYVDTPDGQYVSYERYPVDGGLASRIEQSENKGVYAALVFYTGNGGFYSSSYSDISFRGYKDYPDTWLEDIARSYNK